MRAAVLLSFLFWLLVLLFAVAVVAAPRCASRSEARALWPRAHLYWTTVDGRRCWSNRRGRAAIPAAGHAARQGPPRVTQASIPDRPAAPFILPPPELLAVAPPAESFDRDRWTWIELARASAPAAPWSTFAPGAEPDIWPRLERGPPLPWAVAVGVLAMLAAWTFARVVGLPSGKSA